MADPIVPDKMEGFTSSRGEAIPFGKQIITTPRGDVEVTDAPGYMTLFVDHPNPEFRRAAWLLYAPDETGVGKGMIAQMTADQARAIAGSLAKLANVLDPNGAN